MAKSRAARRGESPALSHGLPAAFVERLAVLLPPGRSAAVLAALAGERPTVFRVNTLRATDAPVLAELAAAGLTVQPLDWLPGAYAVPAAQRRALTDSAALGRGDVYIQNPSSMLPPLVLDPQPGERVLDLAAAPGSKTLQMAALMNNQGWISAVEPVRDRFFRLRANLERHGAGIVHTYQKDGIGVWRLVPEQFDRVLLDAPCSSEGQFQAGREESFRYWSLKKVREMARKQKRLLYSAVQCLKPGGTLVYSTCTLGVEENEAIIDGALTRFGDALQVIPVRLAVPGALPGLDEWQGKHFDPALTGALRVVPDAMLEGFFVCHLVKRRSTLESN